MSTEDLVETLIYEGMKSYQRNSRGSKNADKLSRHEPVEMFGYTFTYWREYATYRAGEWIKELLPSVSVEVILDGNNSTLKLELTDEEQMKLNCKLYNFLEKFNKI